MSPASGLITSIAAFLAFILLYFLFLAHVWQLDGSFCWLHLGSPSPVLLRGHTLLALRAFFLAVLLYSSQLSLLGLFSLRGPPGAFPLACGPWWECLLLAETVACRERGSPE